MKRSFPALCRAVALVLFICAGSAFLPSDQLQPVVTGASTSVVELKPGGDPVVVSVQGRNLDRAARLQVILKGNPVSEITANFGLKTGTSIKISLKAGANALPGDNYQLRVISDMGIADVPLEYLRIKVLKLPPQGAPVITSLRINNGEAQTQSRSIGLNFETDIGWFFWRYRVTYPGHQADFHDWNRRPTSWPVHAQLEDTSQTQTVCVQVQTFDGILSNVKCASITYVYVYDVEVKLNAADIYNNAGGNRTTRCIRSDFGSVCSHFIGPESFIIRVGYSSGEGPGPGINNPAGTKCDWLIYENLRLKPGWQFVRADYAFVQIGGKDKCSDSSFLQEPAVGGRGLTYKVRVWANSFCTARFQLNSITVKGPSNQEVWRNNLIQIFE